MGMIRGKVHHPKFWDIVKGPQRIQVNEPAWDHCEIHDKYYDKETGKEVQVVKTSLTEFLEDCKLPCCKEEKSP